MRDQMLNHGLDEPLLTTQTGYFQITFPGSGDDIERIRVPEARLRVTPAVEAQLSKRQKNMVSRLIGGEALTNRRCQRLYKISSQAVYEDFQKLLGLGIVRKVGSGRSTRYELNPHG